MLRVCRQAHRETCAGDDDLVIGLQLTHSGRYSYRQPLIPVHDPVLDQRTVIDKTTGQTLAGDYPTLSDVYKYAAFDALGQLNKLRGDAPAAPMAPTS